VIAAPLNNATARAALRDGLGRVAGQLRYVECRAADAEVQRRARARQADPSRESDATAALAARLSAQWQVLDEVHAHDHLVLRTDRRVEEAVLDLTLWLDHRWTCRPGPGVCAQEVPGGA
jgi:predicted kinase